MYEALGRLELYLQVRMEVEKAQSLRPTLPRFVALKGWAHGRTEQPTGCPV